MTFAVVGITDMSEATGDYGNTVEVTGDGVPAGALVELFWDDTTINWNGVKGKLNSTTADSDGTWEVWFDVPEATAGTHNVWVKAGGEYDSAAYIVVPRVKPASSSGEGLDKVDVNVYGQAGSKDVNLLFVVDSDIANWNWVAHATVDGGTLGDTEYDGDLNAIIEPGSFTATDGVQTIVDDGDGTLSGDGDGKINYVTGEWEVEFDLATVADVDIDYNYLNDLADDTKALDSGETNSVGSWLKRITIPDWTPGSYYLATLDAKGNTGAKDFEIGAVLTATPDEVNVGDIVTVSGRGFHENGFILQADVTIGGLPAVILDYSVHEDIDSDGEFSFKVVVPQIPDKEEDYDVSVEDDDGNIATAEITVNEKASITITPDYGPQGSTVTVTGKNFPNVKEEDIGLELEIGGQWIKDFETNSDGTFSGTFRVPAVDDGDYKINAYWDSPEGEDVISDTADFRIGSILVLLSDDSGPAGMEVILTGNGFTNDGGWNATFGDVTIFEDEQAGGTGLLGAMTFYVPQVEPGIYDITVLDEESEIEVVVEFEVTHATFFEIMPSEAPAGYNVTFEGMYWSEDQVPTFEFVVYNDTEEWDITADVWKVMSDGGGGQNNFMTGDMDGSEADDGAFTAWWYIGDMNPKDAMDVFSKGTYWLNVTYGDDFFYQTSFTVGDEHVRIAPRKSAFRIGDTLSFSIEHSFGNNPDADIGDGYVDIFDPSGNRYFRTDDLDVDLWVKSGMFYYVPIAAQTDNANPMILLDDAPLGTWSYKWYENDGETLIDEGTFTVAESTENLITGKIEDLNNQITDLQDSISDVTSEFDDVKSDIANVAAVAQQAVTAAQQAAQAVQTVAQTANQANTAAQNAADAANAAKDAANGLTTLVYGAIGAALVAALAAIVSLMQISRRIAG
jgi:hypothetical protein